ncbi:cytochrome P450 [Dictyobacter alpinus]|uniref:Cytochrome P450 n=1 Tax=Dictyobacter alpinus TaxID=2014873 RepID=A0A402B0V3_9CHLR|nr:cytochrome P450 [Dictyobacter alpinus]GCE24981.1 cytochrome P450 [Dictyobacter alpinus]
MATEIKETSGTKTIPGISEAPFVGSLFRHNNDRLNLYQQVAQDCGDIALFHYGPFRFIQINSAELARSLLVEHTADFDKGDGMRSAFQPVIGNGLFISDGALHRQQRKLMAPSFQPRHIISYANTMVHYSEQIQEGWRDGQVIDIGHELTQLTMSIVGKVLFDAEVFTEADELGSAMTTVLSFINYSLSNLFSIPLSWPVPRSKKAQQALAVLDRRINQMIADRHASKDEANDFLSVLLRSKEDDGSSMSDKQVRDEALTLFGAGHETTATALTWAWYLLAQNPEIFKKMQHEIDTVLQGRAPTYADLQKLPYTLQVFKEAMRLYPPAYAVSRVALHDCDLNGYPIKKQDVVIMAIYAMHRRPEYFPDPDAFDPERFTAENEKRLPRHAYLPFGAGPRICIGNHFALMEGQLLLATLAQRVSLELVPGQHVHPDPNKTITIRPDVPIKMVVHRRPKND